MLAGISMQIVGVFKAKTHLSQLLDQVEAGEKIMITRHGEPVAMLVPAKPSPHEEQTRQLIAEIRATRIGTSLEGITVKELVNEGRKY